MTQRAIAQKLGISVSGMKSRVQRGRQKLKELLQNYCQIQRDAVGNVIEYEMKVFMFSIFLFLFLSVGFFIYRLYFLPKKTIFDDDKRVANFRSMDKIFPLKWIRRSSNPHLLNIYINPQKNLVIVKTSSGSWTMTAKDDDEAVALFRAIAKKLE